MCLSRLGQIIYGVVMFFALSLTIAGLMSPGWREVKLRVSDTSVDANHPRDSADNVDEHINLGLFGFFCTSTSSTDSNATPKNKADAEEYCKNWWKNLSNWEKAVISLVSLAVIFETIALIYNFITLCCCCCCRGHALKPLSFLALVCFIMLGVAICIYGVKNKDALSENKDYRDSKNTVGYSFFLECAALGLLLINVLIGTLSACFGDKGCLC